MSPFLSVACPVSCAVSVSLLGLVAKQYPRTREVLIKVGRKVGREALQTVLEAVTRSLDDGAGRPPGVAVAV